MRNFLLIMGVALCPLYTHAADVNIVLSGSLSATGCNISLNSQNQSVYIGDFAPSAFSQVGDVSDAKSFDIELKACSQEITGTTITFTGDKDPDDAALLALSDTKGTGEMATGIGVQISDDKNNSIALDSKSIKYPLKAGDNVLTFSLRYKATRLPVTSGNASAVMYFDLAYE